MKVTFDGPNHPAPRRLDRLRDGQVVSVPAVATFTPEAPDGPTVEIVVDVHAGNAVITRACLIGSGEHPVSATALRGFSLQRLAELTFRELTMSEVRASNMRLEAAFKRTMEAMGIDADGPTYSFDDTAASRESVVNALRQRETVDRDRLEEVAKWYHEGGAPRVERELFVSRSQAYRLIRRARDAQLIEEES